MGPQGGTDVPLKIALPLTMALSLMLLVHCGDSEAPPESASPEPEPPETVESTRLRAPVEETPPAEPEAQVAPEPQVRPKVRLETSMGAMVVELYPDRSPETVENFLQYVDDQFYDGTIFHRVIPDFMIQGGGFTPAMQEKQTRPSIQNESANALSNLRYTLAMARTPDPHSASAQFFINHKTNRFLDKDQASDGWGYCVFGKVVDGTNVVDSISQVATGSSSGHQDVPREPVVIRTARRVG